jgi:hypothetical protein
MAKSNNDRPNIRVEAGGSVSLSADQVGRDKVVNRLPDRLSKDEIRDEISPQEKEVVDTIPTIMSWVKTIPGLMKLVEFVRILLESIKL